MDLSRQAFGVDNARIYSSMLQFYDYLDVDLRQDLLDSSVEAFHYFDQDFINNNYYFRRCFPFRWDGIRLPFNQQNSLGIMSAHLYNILDQEVYLDRVEVLYNNFSSEFSDNDSFVLWRYWGDFFYQGWDNSEVNSCNAPSRKKIDNPSFEDISHAAININFVNKATEILGVANPISLDRIGGAIELNLNYFSKRIDGGSGNSGMTTRLPRWPYTMASNIARYYSKWHASINPDFAAGQSLLKSYVMAIHADDKVNDEVFHIKEYNFKNSFLDLTNEHSISYLSEDKMCSYLGENYECYKLIESYIRQIDFKKR